MTIVQRITIAPQRRTRSRHQFDSIFSLATITTIMAAFCLSFFTLCVIALSLMAMTAVTTAFQATHIQHRQPSTTLEAVSSRKAFLASAAASAVVVGLAVPEARADEYDDARAAKRAKAAESNGGTALAVPLIGGLALSLPFFLPNILRLLGIKNSKMK